MEKLCKKDKRHYTELTSLSIITDQVIFHHTGCLECKYGIYQMGNIYILCLIIPVLKITTVQYVYRL